jgi:hypothetical protein
MSKKKDCKACDLAQEVISECALAKEHADKAGKLALLMGSLCEKTHDVNVEETVQKKPTKLKKGTFIDFESLQISTPVKKEQNQNLVRICLSGGASGARFKPFKKDIAEQKLSEMFPGRLEWAKSQVDYLVFSDDETDASDSAKKRLKKDSGDKSKVLGKVMSYSQFIKSFK